MHEIKDVEIFATGNHNGDTYTEADLDEMVANYSKVGYMPPLKDGYCKDKPGMPALGWIQNVRRMGNKLVADFVDLHEKVYEAIKTRRYGTVSSEIYWNLKNNNGTFKKALKAVALLGAEIPGVADLRPLREVVFNAEGVRRYTTRFSTFNKEKEVEKINVYEEAAMKKEIQDARVEVIHAAGLVVDQRTKEYMRDYREPDYEKAMKAVLAADTGLKEQYAGV